MAPFLWKSGETNRFLLRGEVQDKKTAYTAWVWRPTRQDWWKLATFRTRTGGKPLAGYYSFIEDFRRDGASVQDLRRARFGHGAVRTLEGNWTPLAQARFTASNAEWESKDNIDAGTVDGWFFLATGGDIKKSRELRSMILLPAGQTNAPANLPPLAAAAAPP